MEHKLIKENLKKEEIIENKKKEEGMSDLEEDTESKATKEEQLEAMITEDVKEKIVAYVRIDEAIRKKNEEIKHLKEMKKPCEEVLIKFLVDAEEEFINLGDKGEKIIKSEKKHKAPLKIDIIKEAIKEHLVAENMVENDEKCANILSNIVTLIDNKRPVTKKVSIRRSVPKEKKNKNKK